MARKIHCEKCDDEFIQNVRNFPGEVYESIEGSAKFNMYCDGCGSSIDMDKLCFAGVLLPSAEHFNYEIDNPTNWAQEFININKTND